MLTQTDWAFTLSLLSSEAYGHHAVIKLSVKAAQMQNCDDECTSGQSQSPFGEKQKTKKKNMGKVQSQRYNSENISWPFQKQFRQCKLPCMFYIHHIE